MSVEKDAEHGNAYNDKRRNANLPFRIEKIFATKPKESELERHSIW